MFNRSWIVVKLAQRVVGFDAGGIIIFDRVTGEVVYDAVYNYSPEEVAKLKHCQPFQRLVKTMGEDYIIRPIEDNFTCLAVSQIDMAVPLAINDEINGVWFIENHKDNRFATNHQKMLETLANLTSTALKNAWLFEKTRIEATVDYFSDLFNRQYFDYIFKNEKEKAKQEGTQLSLIMVDINRLKYINDTLGHYMGDYVIKETAVLLKNSVRQSELVFRFGGDEMVILLSGTDSVQTAKVVQRIKTNVIEWNQNCHDSRVFLHLSVGCYTADNEEALNVLVEMADKDMYRDKEEYYKLLGLTRQSQGPR